MALASTFSLIRLDVDAAFATTSLLCSGLIVRFIYAIAVAALSAHHASAGALPLNVYSSGESTYYEYFSDGFFRMDLVIPAKPTNQSFHAISDPSVIYNNDFDGFPNDNEFRFGSLIFDEAGLVGSTGAAPVTGFTFDMAKDPANPTYMNWRRFTTNTLIDSFQGEVEVVNGRPVALNLTADFRFEVVGFLGASITGYYPGTLEFSGSQFELRAEGMPVLDTAFGTGPVHLEWDFSGEVKAFAPIQGDYDRNGLVDGADFLFWQRSFGTNASPAGVGADGDGSGVVDAADLAVWRQHFGSQIAITSSSVPEPAVAILASPAVAVLIVAARRRRVVRAIGG